MNFKDRYLTKHIITDLRSKMVFIAGARQVGKTSLSKYIAEGFFKGHEYLNWDFSEDRVKMLNIRFKGDAELIIFDEIHKYKNWKNYLKGLYDKEGDKYRLLITGSARLDVYRRGGDSMMGRYYPYRLHPFTLSEFLGIDNAVTPFEPLLFPQVNRETQEAFEALRRFGGFPEPLLSQDENTLRRWHNLRLERLIREDIRDLENIRNLSSLQIMVDLLPSKVGSLFSLNSMREDLSVSHKTIADWAEMLERFYYHFRVYPYTKKGFRSLKKEPKLYLYDWSQVEHSEGARLENMVASHLFKLCHYLHDTAGYNAELYFLRDTEGREVDFLVTIKGRPWFAVEVKSSDKEVSRHLLYFKKKLNIPFLYQVVLDSGIDFIQNDIRVLSADKFLSGLI